MSPIPSRQSCGSRCIALREGNVGQPHELAAMELFLASDDTSYVNGQAIPVDGGLTASTLYAGKPI